MRTDVRNKLFILAASLVLLAVIWLRISSYGDFRLSIGHADTPSYIASSRSPLFSWKIFAGTRLFTTNLLYKFANDGIECPLIAISNPALGLEGRLRLQPCFDKITTLQNTLSITSWCLAAWLLSRRLKHPFLKFASALLILAFAFTPQIAEWDFILSPESLTLSLFVAAFALLYEIGFRIAETKDRIISRSTLALISAWLIVFIGWVFIRDVHLYAVPVTLALTGLLLLDSKFRKNRTLLALVLLLAGIFILGSKSAQDSLRATHYPLEHAFEAYIFPHPSRVDFMEGLGMPERDSPDFQAWFDANATRVYGLFLISHPRFVLATLWNDLFYLSSDFEQPYFKADEVIWRETLLKIGEFLHPQTTAVYLIDLLLLVTLYVKAIRLRTPTLTTWAWLGTWFFLCSTATLLPTFFGDTVGTRRHIFPSVEMFRLFLWVFLMPYLDRFAETDLAPQKEPDTAVVAKATVS